MHAMKEERRLIVHAVHCILNTTVYYDRSNYYMVDWFIITF
jgi:hypothetical protein